MDTESFWRDHMLTFVILAALTVMWLVLFLVDQSPAQTYTIYNGAGTRECRYLLDSLRIDPRFREFTESYAAENERDLYAWIGGYLTGVNEIRGGNVAADDLDVIVAQVKSYCRTHPDE
jgi:hypothetical protein